MTGDHGPVGYDGSSVISAGDDEVGPPGFEHCHANSSCGPNFLAYGNAKSLICVPPPVSYMVRTEGNRSIGFSRLLSPHYTFEVMSRECSLCNGPQLSTSVVDSISCARFQFQNSRLHCYRWG